MREMVKLLLTRNFSFFHSVFYPFWELFAIFIKFRIVVCKLIQFGRVENLSYGTGLKEAECVYRLTSDNVGLMLLQKH